MKTPEFVATLMPSFERSRLVSLISDTRNQLKENLIPTYTNAVESFSTHGFKSKPANAFNAFIGSKVHMRHAGNGLAGVLAILEGIPKQLDVLDVEINKVFSKDISREAVTYRQASILQTVNALAFVAEYAGPLLDRIVCAEIDVQNGMESKVDSHLLPAVKKYLDGQLDAFGDGLNVASITASALKSHLDGIPEITVIPENQDTVEHTVGKGKLDPMNFGFFGLSTNPAYFIGKWWADLQVGRYNAAQEERKTIELRLLALRQAWNGHQDPKLEQQIEYNANRAESLLRKVRQMEAKWA